VDPVWVAAIIGHLKQSQASLTHTDPGNRFMDRQEKHQQQKAKERDQKYKKEKVYEEVQQKRRLPVNSVWLIVVGVLLTAVIVYVWIVGIFRTPN
jgi:hypothetical protein